MNRILVSMQEGLSEPEWFNKVQEFESLVLQKLGYNGEEISILFCNDDFIKDLNNRFRNIDKETDILSFENGEEYEDEEGKWLCIGDMIISLETLPKNAEYFNVAQNEELKRLLIHGTLHLNGMDHGEAHIESGIKVEDEMLCLQEQILQQVSDFNFF